MQVMLESSTMLHAPFVGPTQPVTHSPVELTPSTSLPPGAGAPKPSFANTMFGGIAVGMAVGQAIGGLYSAWSLGKTLKYQLETQAKIDKINARIAQLGAETAFRAGEAEVARITHRAGQIKARQNVAYAANGVATDYGSAAEQKASTDIMKEVDVQTANLNALANAWGYRQQSSNLLSASYAHQAQGAIEMGKQSAMAISTLAGSVGDIHEKWSRFQFRGGK